jgi:hypothetical protein
MAPEYDPEKWKPVFRTDHAQAKQERHLIRSKSMALSGCVLIAIDDA